MGPCRNGLGILAFGIVAVFATGCSGSAVDADEAGPVEGSDDRTTRKWNGRAHAAEARTHRSARRSSIPQRGGHAREARAEGKPSLQAEPQQLRDPENRDVGVRAPGDESRKRVHAETRRTRELPAFVEGRDRQSG